MVLSSSNPTTATIPNVVATHLVGDRNLQIARGQLTLQPTPHALAKATATATPAGKGNNAAANDATLPSHHAQSDVGIDPNIPVLLLSVGNATWPLYPSTLFGTHDKDETLYTFLAELAPPEDSQDVDDDVDAKPNAPQSEAQMTPTAGPTAGPTATSAAALPATKKSSTATWIRLTLPAAVCAYKSPVQLGRDRMETLLLKYGLLKQGFAAAADEVAKSAQQSGNQAAASIRTKTEGYLSSTPATSLPVSFSDRTRRAAATAASSTSTASSYTHAASEAIAGVAHSAGAAVGKAFAWTRRASHDQGSTTDEEVGGSTAGSSSGGGGGGGGGKLERRPSTGRRISLERFGFGRSKSPHPPQVSAHSGTASPTTGMPPPSSSSTGQNDTHLTAPQAHITPSYTSHNPNSQLTTIQSMGEAAEGIAAATSSVASAGVESLHRVIENDHGSQAADVAGDAGKVAANTAKVGWDATVATSVVAHGAVAGKGAYDYSAPPPPSSDAGAGAEAK